MCIAPKIIVGLLSAVDAVLGRESNDLTVEITSESNGATATRGGARFGIELGPADMALKPSQS